MNPTNSATPYSPLVRQTVAGSENVPFAGLPYHLQPTVALPVDVRQDAIADGNAFGDVLANEVELRRLITRCPIGLDDSPHLCSAGTCTVCILKQEIANLRAELAAARKSLYILDAALECANLAYPQEALIHCESCSPSFSCWKIGDKCRKLSFVPPNVDAPARARIPVVIGGHVSYVPEHFISKINKLETELAAARKAQP